MSTLKGFQILREKYEALIFQSSLYLFVKHFWPYIESQQYVDNWHIEGICKHLQAISENKLKRLLINIPPGCSKSLLVSVFWPCWEWTFRPQTRWFFTSYDQRLASRDSVKCRNLILSEEYQRLWGNQFSIVRDQNQKTYYETSCGGYRLATNVGGHSTGQHPDRIVCDDPHSATQAESDVERQSVLDWWDLSMSTRGVSRNSSRVIVMQRFHQNDLSGHELNRGGYTLICLPMRWEPDRMEATPLGWTDPRTIEGELLTPNQFSEESVREMERTLGEYATAGQLQQRPRPKSGGMFREHYFSNRIRVAPYNTRRIRYWDRASATTEGACYSVGILMSMDEGGAIYVEDMVRGKWAPDERNKVMRATAIRDRQKYGPKYEPHIYVEREGGSSGRDAWLGIVRCLTGFSVFEDTVTGKKDVRAEPWAAQLAGGNVFIVDNGESEGSGRAAWDINYFVEEHLAFRPEPNSRLGRLKDVVDSSSGALNLLIGTKRVLPLRTISLGKQKNQLRILVCTKDELESTIIDDHRCLLIHTEDYGTDPVLPAHGIRFLIGDYGMAFADIRAEDYQATWDEPIFPYGATAKEIYLQSDQARDMWKFLLKRYNVAYDVIVIQGSEDRRAVSLACGIADTFRYSRKSCISFAAGPHVELDKFELNTYVIDVVKTARMRLVT